ncbi:hypothetical protein [Methylobacterium sp. 13MFTsu3.1M2]|uniref:hypothetical protein n=1 Tax=Methylobacterium sp. 13MFTsu3.1M2 TaxID=1502776 RepID=UPI000B829AD4|nr:hypothetical protein [Methylobacterium sp. 13MFTsu3.1M2]
MRSTTSCAAVLVLAAVVVSASPTQARPTAGSPDAKGTFVEPANAPHRHCAGSCLRSGALQWFCKPHQTCSLDCGTAPPRMHCHDPMR